MWQLASSMQFRDTACAGGEEPLTNFALDVDRVGTRGSWPPLRRKVSALPSQGMLPDMPHRVPAHKRPLSCSCQLIPAPFAYSLLMSACSETGSSRCCFPLGHRRAMWGETAARRELLLPLPSLPGPSPASHPHPTPARGLSTQPEAAAGAKEELEASLQRDHASSNG